MATSSTISSSNSATSSRSVLLSILAILIASVATAASAHLRMYLPNSPVPITLQTLIVVLSGALLGANRGALSQVFVAAWSLSGIAVYTQPQALIGPTGGYLIGFILTAYFAGWMKSAGHLRVNEVSLRTLGRIYSWLLLASVAVFIPGVLWLKAWMGISLKTALTLGFLPFIIGDLIKTAIATSVVLGREFELKVRKARRRS